MCAGPTAAWIRGAGGRPAAQLRPDGPRVLDDRHEGLLPYARALRDAGHLVLVFDHRHLGDSGGEPRQRFREAEQRADSPGVFLAIALHRPHRKASSIPTPLWVGLGDRDITVAAPAVRKLAERAPRGELHRYDVDHFEPFHTDAWRAIAADQVTFLDRVLPVGRVGV
ncbi:hypothetical protein AB0L40_14905 [Patulibacter sp. NPDC049589]|uniref:hypothetical protein n=1 Tax=Patulibacter sp. NPDC049589 TaxID=3154731 RepID=UPI0034469144